MIVDTPKERGNRLGEARDFDKPLGKGIGALVDDRKLATGSHRFMAEADLELSALTDDAERLGGRGARVVLIAIDGKAGEPVTIADRIKVAAPTAVRAGGRRSSASRS